ncbi:hypothetical protein BH11PSE14_BH11PSE14_07580 [soil metagenome]
MGSNDDQLFDMGFLAADRLLGEPPLVRELLGPAVAIWIENRTAENQRSRGGRGCGADSGAQLGKAAITLGKHSSPFAP